MEDSEKEMDFDNLLNKFKELNPDIDISINFPKLKKDIQKIYVIYEKIKIFFFPF